MARTKILTSEHSILKTIRNNLIDSYVMFVKSGKTVVDAAMEINNILEVLGLEELDEAKLMDELARRANIQGDY